MTPNEQRNIARLVVDDMAAIIGFLGEDLATLQNIVGFIEEAAAAEPPRDLEINWRIEDFQGVLASLVGWGERLKPHAAQFKCATGKGSASV